MFTIWDKVKSKNIKNIDGIITWIIEKIREQYELSQKNKEEKYRKKFDDMLKKEQFGKKGFKKSLKTEKTKKKKEERVLKSKRKDDYDFTWKKRNMIL